MSVSETIIGASIANIADRDGLAMAYGIFGMLYRVSWSIESS